MKKSELIETINKALTRKITFNQWIKEAFINWANETDVKTPDLSNYSKYLDIDLDILLGWITEDAPKPENPEIQTKLWEKYGFIYCFVANTPPPAPLFPEGSSPIEIRNAFENLRSVLVSGEFPFEELEDIESALRLMSSIL